MSFTWHHFLEVARALRAQGDEASLRTATCRAYYAVFGQARIFAEAESGKKIANDSAHKSVYEYFDNPAIVNRQLFASDLKRLKALRTRADYYLTAFDDVRYTDEAISSAEKLLADLGSL